MAQRVGGLVIFKADGVEYRAKGNFTYNIGRPKRETVVGADGIHGYKETHQPAFIEGEVTDSASLDLDALVSLKNASVYLELGNGKAIALRDAWFAAEGTANTEEGNIQVRFEGKNGEEVA